MRADVRTDQAGIYSAVIVRIEGHAPLVLEPDQAAELAKLIGEAGKQAAAERRAGTAPIPERRKAAATA